MNRMTIFLAIVMVFLLYVFFGIKSLFANTNYHLAYVVSHLLLIALFFFGMYITYKSFGGRELTRSFGANFLISFTFAFLIFNLVMAFFLLIDDVVRGIEYVYNLVVKLSRDNATEVPLHARRGFIQKLGLLVAGIPFLSLLYGNLRNKYNYNVKNVKLSFKNLPKAFDGFKIVQISDVHSGSFDNVECVQKGVDIINQQNADVVLFTGDLVNNDSREIIPYIDTFKQITSKYGTFSSLGNHDYGIYNSWPTKEAQQENFELLFDYQKQMNFDLLNNENRTIEKDGEKIHIVGVENWGKKGRFPQRGDIDKALQGVNDEDFKILLSHDPTHWNEVVLKHKTPVEITFAGHTHGMQFGIEIPGFRWSPVKYIYPRWAGLYKENNQHLYVNRGFGFLGYPGRVGILPEITVVELTREV